MDLGIVGLGRMGANLTRRLLRDGHRVVVSDVDAAAVDALVSEGADGAAVDEARRLTLAAPSAASLHGHEPERLEILCRHGR